MYEDEHPVKQVSDVSAFWMRRTVVLVLSPVGLLLIAVTRLLIIADYNTATATAIASSGGYVNTLLGTVIPLVPVILPYLAIVLLVLKRFVLSALTFGATLLVTPTQLAPLTALKFWSEDWHRVVVLFRNPWVAIGLPLLLLMVLIVVISLFAEAFGGHRVLAMMLALLVAAYLFPYILSVYPFPRTSGYYADFMRQPWLPAERVTVTSGHSIIGYAVAQNGQWTIVLKDSPRVIEYIPSHDVISRSVCQINPQTANIPKAPLIPLLNPQAARVPSCSLPRPRPPASSANQRSAQWTTRRVTTSGTRFRAVPGLRKLTLCASDELKVTVSVELSGAPAGFRVRIDRHLSMEPGRVRFVPAGTHDSFSFTFVQGLAPLNGLDRHFVQLQWRSPYGIATSLERATVAVAYSGDSSSC